jgi:hypothetical protein
MEQFGMSQTVHCTMNMARSLLEVILFKGRPPDPRTSVHGNFTLSTFIQIYD